MNITQSASRSLPDDAPPKQAAIRPVSLLREDARRAAEPHGEQPRRRTDTTRGEADGIVQGTTTVSPGFSSMFCSTFFCFTTSL